MQGRLVAEKGVVGVGATGTGVELAQEVPQPAGGLPAAADRAEEAGGVVGNHPAVLDRVALDEATAAAVVVARREGTVFVARLDHAAAAVEELAPVA